MSNLSVSTKEDLQKFIENKSFSKILIIAAQSFNSSGLKEFFFRIKKILFFLKRNPIHFNNQ